MAWFDLAEVVGGEDGTPVLRRGGGTQGEKMEKIFEGRRR